MLMWGRAAMWKHNISAAWLCPSQSVRLANLLCLFLTLNKVIKEAYRGGKEIVYMLVYVISETKSNMFDGHVWVGKILQFY